MFDYKRSGFDLKEETIDFELLEFEKNPVFVVINNGKPKVNFINFPRIFDSDNQINYVINWFLNGALNMALKMKV